MSKLEAIPGAINTCELYVCSEGIFESTYERWD